MMKPKSLIVASVILAFVARDIISIATAVAQNDESRVEQLERRVEQLERRMGMSYTNDGSVYQEGEQKTGGFTFHRVSGTATLSSGVDTITLSAAGAGSRADVTFRGSDSYRGGVTPMSDPSGKSYYIVPLSGTRFLIVSSDTSDNSTIRYDVEGE